MPSAVRVKPVQLKDQSNKKGSLAPPGRESGGGGSRSGSRLGPLLPLCAYIQGKHPGEHIGVKIW
jgi:hypothetical protein